MFDSRLTDWNIVGSDTLRQRRIGMLAAEMSQAGIKLFLYHSQWTGIDRLFSARAHGIGRAPDSGLDA